MMRVADYVCQRLVEEGIRVPFVVTGRGALFLNDALAKSEELKPCFVHHEQSAAFAAIAASEVSETMGCAVVSTGCASTNCITGVLSAWQDGLPAIFVSGQNTLEETTRYTGLGIRTYGQQEADIISLVNPITKYAVMLTGPKQVCYELEKALYLAKEGRKGPVWIDIPLNVQNMRVEEDELVPFVARESFKEFDEEGFNEVLKDLEKAERPVVLIGSGIKHSKTEKALAEFIEENSIPLVYTSAACDVYPSQNRNSIGSLSSMGASRAGAFTVQNSDYLLVLGSRLNSMTTGVDFCKFAREAKITVVDIDPVEHSKEGIKIDQFLELDLRIFFDHLSKSNFKLSNEAWLDKCLHWKNLFKQNYQVDDTCSEVDIYDLADCFSETLSEDAIFVCDSGFADVILPTNISFKNGQSCIHPVSQGAMGFSLPAALGLEKTTGRPTVVVVGDGSIMMNLQELQTISDHRCNIKVFVINNNAYAIIRRRQKELFRKRTIGTDDSNGVNCPEFSKVANCFGLEYKLIDSHENLAEKVENVLAMEGPVLCEIMGKEDQQYVEVSFARTSSRKFERRPIEDQAPFLDRELFLEEMIIEPIDQ